MRRNVNRVNRSECCMPASTSSNSLCWIKDATTSAKILAQWNQCWFFNGWMTARNFYEYVVNIFHPWLLKNKIVFPVVLYVNGHSSHTSLSLSQFCQKKQIELIALKANSTHILQQLDVAAKVYGILQEEQSH